jgi:uncharacterized peroxidase-related enzyme
MAINHTLETQLAPLTYEEASSTLKPIFDQIKKGAGRVPNLMATIGNSPVALEAILAFGNTLGKGQLNRKEVETVSLAVSQANDCEYCIAAHTTVLKMNGITDEETVEIRRGTAKDKLGALAQLAHELVRTHGHPSQESIDRFFAAGYNKAALVEVVGVVSANYFNNYINHISNTPVDFPAVTSL